MLRPLWLLLVLVLSTGCGDDGDAKGSTSRSPTDPTRKPGTWPAASKRQLDADHYPAPYTVEQLRRGCADGRTSTFRFDMYGSEMLQRWRFDQGDADGVTWTAESLDPDGSLRGEPTAQRRAWTDLQRHASYPVAGTTVTEETITVPAGTFACMHYTVRETRKGTALADGKKVPTAREATTHCWFAWALPGPPVRMEQFVEGKRVSLMELVEHETAEVR